MLRVRLFAGLREQSGWSDRQVALPADGDATPAALWRDLALGGEALPATVRVAVNQAFAAPDTPLRGGDEVAFLPPVSGG